MGTCAAAPVRRCGEEGRPWDLRGPMATAGDYCRGGKWMICLFALLTVTILLVQHHDSAITVDQVVSESDSAPTTSLIQVMRSSTADETQHSSRKARAPAKAEDTMPEDAHANGQPTASQSDIDAGSSSDADSAQQALELSDVSEAVIEAVTSDDKGAMAPLLPLGSLLGRHTTTPLLTKPSLGS